MEPSDPTDQPEPTPVELPDQETWAQTSAWAPTAPPVATPGVADSPESAPPPAIWNPPPAAIAEPPSPADYAPPVPTALPGVKIRRSRGKSTIVAWAMIAEVVLIAAVGNQWLTKQVEDWLSNRHSSGLTENLVLASQTYDWRFAPASDDFDHGWAASLTMLAVVFLVTAAVLLALTRGGVSQGRAFWSGLLAVVFATQVGLVAGGLVFNTSFPRRYVDYLPAASGPPGPGSGVSHRIANALFGLASPSGYSFVGSVAFGIVVGLVAVLAAGRSERDDDPRLAAIRERRVILPPSVPATPAVWMPTPGAEPSPGDSGRHSRTD